MLTVTVDEKAGTLTIVLPLTPPRPSTSGKTDIVGGTNGAFKTGQLVAGRPLTINCSAYIPKQG